MILKPHTVKTVGFLAIQKYVTDGLTTLFFVVLRFCFEMKCFSLFRKIKQIIGYAEKIDSLAAVDQN